MEDRSPSSRPRRSRVTTRDALEAILGRLNAIESGMSSSSAAVPTPAPLTPPLLTPFPLQVQVHDVEGAGSIAETAAPSGYPKTSVTQRDNTADDVANRIAGALSTLVQVRSNQYYVSNFDPSVHDFDVWCTEVERARMTNDWGDNECLSRVGACLKGDAKSWLNEWVCNDRTWSNFKSEFRALCPRSVDTAGILFEVLSCDSKKYATYAEYARHSLLRLNIVNGLSDDLKTAIVVRGIAGPLVKAAASNAKLKPHELVQFLSHFIQPKSDLCSHRDPGRSSEGNTGSKRVLVEMDNLKCFCVL